MTYSSALPAWTGMGILPPIKPGISGNSLERSPYQIDLHGFFEHFALSQERIEILTGFLAFRTELHKLGITQGFQWLDGSFLENIEAAKILEITKGSIK
jgi:hypothetical protein